MNLFVLRVKGLHLTKEKQRSNCVCMNPGFSKNSVAK